MNWTCAKLSLIHLFLFFLLGVAPTGVRASQLVSNFVFGVQPGVAPGQLWLVTRGEAGNGTTRLRLQYTQGILQVEIGTSNRFPEGVVAVQDGFFADLTGELRRLPALHTSDGLLVPAYRALEGRQSPRGFLRVGSGTAPADTLPWSLPLEPPMGAAIHSMLPWGNTLQLAMGNAGVGQILLDSAGGLPNPLSLNLRIPRRDSLHWVNLATCVGHIICDSLNVVRRTLDSTEFPAVLSLAADTLRGRLWIGTARGLLQGNDSLLDLAGHPHLDTARITGVWMQGNNILVETAFRQGTRTRSALYWSNSGGAMFSPVQLGQQSNQNYYDSLHTSVSGVAFLGDRAWVGLLPIEGNRNGLLLLEGANALPVPDSLRRDESLFGRFVHGPGTGILEYDAPVTGVTDFALDGQRRGLAVSLFGAGVALSADSGRTWRTVLNLAPVRGGLREVRITPSVLRFAGTEARISYRLDSPSPVRIEVFSYDMERVRTVVAGAHRNADPLRSSHPREDVWDGRNDAGNFVAAGLYYVRVRASGREAWGKIYWGGGN